MSARDKGTQEKKAFLRQYKMERGCAVCGYNKMPAVLELDHIDRSKKTMRMKKAAQHMSWARIHAELENCQVLCANCHREKTVRERDYYSVDRVEEDDPQMDLL